MFSLSEITSLFDLSRYLDRSLGSAKVLSQKVKSPNMLEMGLRIFPVFIFKCTFISCHIISFHLFSFV